MFYEFKHPVSADYFRREVGVDFTFPAHLHHCFEFLTVTEGAMEVEVDGQSCTISVGEGMLFFPNQIHAMRTPVHSRHVLCLFSPDLVSAYAETVSGKMPVGNLFRPDRVYLDQLWNLPDEPNRFALKGLLYALCGCFDEAAEYRTAEAAERTLLHKIFSFIEQNYTAECTLEALARQLGYDYAYLSRYFKKTVGLSYNEYLNQYRISHACHLLQNTSMTVLEVSAECGFGALRSFNRNFKAQLNLTPADYRRRVSRV